MSGFWKDVEQVLSVKVSEWEKIQSTGCNADHTSGFWRDVEQVLSVKVSEISYSPLAAMLITCPGFGGM
ncbi:hypothetical protein Pmani_000567 [Petrolisthes manimaculis]|uniref:Uncharacterized protein n=1 Tax=Petrolisthes manimaculis TaxID=1843537 RepID=A0AAE1USW0_9EUCA|nr:hypothetical protein Pmani_000567 [Petrolisthes manimaculis]